MIHIDYGKVYSLGRNCEYSTVCELFEACHSFSSIFLIGQSKDTHPWNSIERRAFQRIELLHCPSFVMEYQPRHLVLRGYIRRTCVTLIMTLSASTPLRSPADTLLTPPMIRLTLRELASYQISIDARKLRKKRTNMASRHESVQWFIVDILRKMAKEFEK